MLSKWPLFNNRLVIWTPQEQTHIHGYYLRRLFPFFHFPTSQWCRRHCSGQCSGEARLANSARCYEVVDPFEPAVFQLIPVCWLLCCHDLLNCAVTDLAVEAITFLLPLLVLDKGSWLYSWQLVCLACCMCMWLCMWLCVWLPFRG